MKLVEAEVPKVKKDNVRRKSKYKNAIMEFLDSGMRSVKIVPDRTDSDAKTMQAGFIRELRKLDAPVGVVRRDGELYLFRKNMP